MDYTDYRLQSEELKGKRVRCIKMNDEYPVPSGIIGTIMYVDDIGTIHVKWDNGSTLGLVQNEDEYKILP
jgi:transcription antitermination factor NusA-like protein